MLVSVHIWWNSFVHINVFFFFFLIGKSKRSAPIRFRKLFLLFISVIQAFDDNICLFLFIYGRMLLFISIIQVFDEHNSFPCSLCSDIFKV